MVGNSTKLVELVRANPCLYDRADPLYLNVNHKRDLWEAIGRQLDVPTAKCKTRWNNMRDSYRKAMMKNTKTYKYSRQLAFLNRFLRTEVPLDATFDASLDEDGEDRDEKVDWDDGSSGREEVKTEPPEPEYRDVSGYYVPEPPPACPDPVDAFLAGIAPALKALGGLELSLAKMEIYQVVHKYELRALQAGESAGGPGGAGGTPDPVALHGAGGD